MLAACFSSSCGATPGDNRRSDNDTSSDCRTSNSRRAAARAARIAKELAALDPAEAVLSLVPVPGHDASATAEIAQHGEGWYRIRYLAGGPSLLRVAEAYFPGWQATGREGSLRVIPVDHALIGVLVPKGEGEILLRFDTPRFWPLLAISLLSLILTASAVGWLWWKARIPVESRQVA